MFIISLLVTALQIKMQHVARFYFHHTLNDFLSRSQRHAWVLYSFTGTPAVKDAIEAIGVPHPEVDVILAGHSPVGFYYPLRTDDVVEVYPFNHVFPSCFSVSAGHTPPDKFILDVHLGRLAKVIRMMGLDACYENGYDDKTIAAKAAAENRIVLTRDIGLLKHGSVRYGYWLRSQQTEEQWKEVMKRYDLKNKVKPFERCLACNGRIIPVTKTEVLQKLPDKTAVYFNEFFQCLGCNKVYWKGGHFKRMEKAVQQLITESR